MLWVEPMGFLLATLLSASPMGGAPFEPQPTVFFNERVAQGPLQVRMDIGGLLLAPWFVPESREQMEVALLHARGTLFGGVPLNGQLLLRATPVVGPWVLATHSEMSNADRALLVTSGLLQLIGFSLAAFQLFGEQPITTEEGPVLSISPTVTGGLGLSFRVRGL